MRGPLGLYRGTGADLPFGDPGRAHPGVAMEGYFWRITDPGAGRVVLALLGVNQGPHGSWGTVGVAGAQVSGAGGVGRRATLATAIAGSAAADPDRLHAWAGPAAGEQMMGGPEVSLDGDDRHLSVRIGDAARIEARFERPLRYPARVFGGSSVFHTVPGLNQYWHPWLLGGAATGWVELDGWRWEFEDARVYGEKNWGRAGFPDSWWWGQAQGFAEPGACVAFAGGQVSVGLLHTEVTALVVRLPDGRTVRLGNPVVSPVRAEVSDDTWRLTGRGGSWRIEVEGRAELADAHVLPVPLPAERRHIAGAIEHLTGSLTVRVCQSGRLVWEGASRLAGLEHGGLARAEAELRRRGAPPGATGAAPV